MVLTICFRKGRCGKRPYLVRGQFGESVGGALGPVAAHNFRNCEERTPVVGEAVESARRQNGIAGGQGVVIVFGPAGEFAGEGFLKVGMVFVEASADLSGLGGNQGNKDRTVVKGGWKLTDAGQYRRGEGFEGTDGIACTLATVSASAAFVSGVKQAAQFVSLVEVSVHFIEQENGLLLVHDAEQNRGAHVLGAKWPWHHGGEDIERSGLATTALG